MEDLWLMTTAHIAKFSGGEIHITTGGSEPTAPNGKILYKTSADGEWLQSNALITNGTFNGFSEKNNAVSVIIPSKDANGNDVTSIGDNAFSGCDKMTNVIIPDGVTSIGSSAFSGSYRLTSVTIPNSVTSIGSRAFFSCSMPMTIPSSVTSIGVAAFGGIQTITIDKTVAQTQAMTPSPSTWNASSYTPLTVICTDGSFTIAG